MPNSDLLFSLQLSTELIVSWRCLSQHQELSSDGQFGDLHFLYQVRIIFSVVHFAFIHTEFHVSFYCPITQFHPFAILHSLLFSLLSWMTSYHQQTLPPRCSSLVNILNRTCPRGTLLIMSLHCENWPFATTLFPVFCSII